MEKHTLSPARQKLIARMARLNYGRIEGLFIKDGEPVFEPGPRLVQEHKFGSAAAAPQRGHEGRLKPQLVELFALFDELGDGVLDALVVQAGLPFRAERTVRANA